MEGLKAAVLAYDAAQKAMDNHINTWGVWYQRDEIVTASDRRAEDRIRNEARRLHQELCVARDLLIAEARKATYGYGE